MSGIALCPLAGDVTNTEYLFFVAPVSGWVQVNISSSKLMC